MPTKPQNNPENKILGADPDNTNLVLSVHEKKPVEYVQASASYRAIHCG